MNTLGDCDGAKPYDDNIHIAIHIEKTITTIANIQVEQLFQVVYKNSYKHSVVLKSN